MTPLRKQHRSHAASPRRGIAAIIIIAVLAMTMAFAGVWARRIVMERRAARRAEEQQQARWLAEAGVRTGGDRRNRDYSGPHLESSASDAHEALAFDPQTAGGLIVSLPADKGAVLAATFADRGLELHLIGRVVAGSGLRLR